MKKLENWRLIGAYVVSDVVIVTIQHRESRDIFQISRPYGELMVEVENGLTDNLIQIVLDAYNIEEL